MICLLLLGKTPGFVWNLELREGSANVLMREIIDMYKENNYRISKISLMYPQLCELSQIIV
jgi:hypothetical protein